MNYPIPRRWRQAATLGLLPRLAARGRAFFHAMRKDLRGYNSPRS